MSAIQRCACGHAKSHHQHMRSGSRGQCIDVTDGVACRCQRFTLGEA